MESWLWDSTTPTSILASSEASYPKTYQVPSFFLFYIDLLFTVVKTHRMKCTTLTIVKCTALTVKHIHIVGPQIA